ncbi:MAG TPA: hypothetical protein VIZ30_10200, partial [Pseudomonadales bacterium]
MSTPVSRTVQAQREDRPVEGLLDRVRAVVPLISSRARDAELARKPDDDVIDALKATGVFRSFVPRRFGGYEISLQTFVDIGVAVSEACPSTGWITTFYMEHNWLLGFFGDELQEDVFRDAPFMLAPGSVNPLSGTAVPKDGGFELTGHWKYATGIVHADWVLLSAQVPAEPNPVQRMCLVRPSDIEVRDTWHVDGMVATGSHDIVANALFVPERQVSLLVPPVVTAGANATYLMRLPVRPFLSLTAAIPALGAARRAVELYRTLIADRVRFGTHKVQSQSAPAQIRLATALADVRAAETVMRDIARRI